MCHCSIVCHHEIGKIYGQLFDCRQSGDYDDFVYYDKIIFEEHRPGTERFIKDIAALMTF